MLGDLIYSSNDTDSDNITIIVCQTRKNYLNRALGDLAKKTKVRTLTFSPSVIVN